MTIIAVSRIFGRTTITQATKLLYRSISGKFKVLDLKPDKAGNKIAYVKLSAKVDVPETIKKINTSTNLKAYIPSKVPDFTVTQVPNKGKPSMKFSKKAVNYTPAQVFASTFEELMCEIQSKFCGLYALSGKTGHKLLDSIGRTIFDRLKKIMEKTPEALGTGFKLSSQYRKLHPHFGDFQMILSTLHGLQDAAGVPRTDVSEQDLMAVKVHPLMLGNVPLKKVQATCAKYSARIGKKITEHLESLKAEESKGDSEEDIARKEVRRHLLNMTPYMQQITNQVIVNHFIPDKAPFHRVRIYGEPFMPNRDVIAPLLKKFNAVMFFRSDRMYNMLRFNVPLQMYNSLMGLDGTVVGGAKLFIRSSDLPRHHSNKLKQDIQALFGLEPSETEVINIQDDDTFTNQDLPPPDSENIEDLEDY